MSRFVPLMVFKASIIPIFFGFRRHDFGESSTIHLSSIRYFHQVSKFLQGVDQILRCDKCFFPALAYLEYFVLLSLRHPVNPPPSFRNMFLVMYFGDS